MSKTISIHQALAEMEELPHFSLSFVRVSGKTRGSIKHLKQARKGGQKGLKRRSGHQPKTLHINNATIPITDIAANRYITPKISHIIAFNGFQVIH